MRRAQLTFVLSVFLLGCGGGPPEDTDGSEVTPAQAQADCARFVSEVYCPGFMKCLPNFTMEDCLATLPGLDCSAVKGESGRLPRCEYEFTMGTCKQKVGNGSMPALPLSCTNVFITDP